MRNFTSLFLLISFALSQHLSAQVVTPWLTTGSKSSLLQQQPTLNFSTSAVGNVSITLDSTVSYQTMDGFGFCFTEGSAEVISSLATTQQDALMAELFGQNGIGMSVIRISIGASDLSSADYSYNETSGDIAMANFSLNGLDKTYLIPLLKKALAINPNIKILATPWTAPRWMKTNLSWMGGYLNTVYYAAYANYFVKYLDAMKAEGISIWGITPQNEPLHLGNDPSMGMSSAEQISFINNNLGPAMAKAGYSAVKIIAYDHNCDNTAYPIDVCNNSSYVDGSAFHLYAGAISALTTVKNATNKNVYFTEQYTGAGGDFSGDFGWHMQNVMIGASNNWAKVVIEWNLATNTNVGPHTAGGCSTCLGGVTINSSTSVTRNVAYYIVAQLSKFVKAGAVRIASSSTSSSMNVVAFKNPDGSTALVAYNSNGSAQSLKVTSGSKSFNYTIPPSSAVTFVWNGTVSAVEKVKVDDFILSPNPVSNSLSVKTEHKCTSFSIYAMNGDKVMSQQMDDNQTNYTINVSALKAGVYVLKMDVNNSIQVRRFLKI